jgi:hypothetical protein
MMNAYELAAGHMSAGSIAQSRRPTPRKPRKRPEVKSQYELYPLPFFDAKNRCTWAVEPTGRYDYDHATGEQFGRRFLKSCDGSYGWATLLGQITADMITAGLNTKAADGRPEINGIVIGFMRTIGNALADPAALGRSAA